MKKIMQIFAVIMLVATTGASVLTATVTAQSTANRCRVEGTSGFYVTESNNTVTARFQIAGDEGCDPTQVSIAVWLAENENGHPINTQRFVSGRTGNFGLIAEGQYPYHSLTTSLPATDDMCFVQVDLVKGGQKGVNGTAQYGNERLINGLVIANPACEEVTTVTEEVEVIREVPVEVVREVPVDRVVERERVVQAPANELPRTGASSLLALPALTGIVGGAAHHFWKRRS